MISRDKFWAGLADFTPISAITVCLLWQTGGIIPDFGADVKGKVGRQRTEDSRRKRARGKPARRAGQKDGGQAARQDIRTGDQMEPETEIWWR
jgi:hypothetical protein